LVWQKIKKGCMVENPTQHDFGRRALPIPRYSASRIYIAALQQEVKYGRVRPA
jgi:hypothetical protein